MNYFYYCGFCLKDKKLRRVFGTETRIQIPFCAKPDCGNIMREIKDKVPDHVEVIEFVQD